MHSLFISLHKPRTSFCFQRSLERGQDRIHHCYHCSWFSIYFACVAYLTFIALNVKVLLISTENWIRKLWITLEVNKFIYITDVYRDTKEIYRKNSNFYYILYSWNDISIQICPLDWIRSGKKTPVFRLSCCINICIHTYICACTHAQTYSSANLPTPSCICTQYKW